MVNQFRRLVVHASGPLLCLGLVACSGTTQDLLDPVLPNKGAVYKSESALPPLEVPPDLSSATLNDSMLVPSLGSGGATYSAYANGNDQLSSVRASGVLPVVSGVSVKRAGDERWLVVDRTPSLVWPKMRDFWLKQGFLIEMEDPSIGIMETDWAEKRVTFNEGGIRNLLNKLSSALYGVATRDKFRTRLERSTVPGSTEIYISHRGAEEVSTGRVTRAQDDTGTEETRVWQPRPSDPELEAEMLNRLMITFGVNEQAAGTMVSQAQSRPPRAHMVRDGEGVTTLALQDNFSRAWRRTGLALDRVGFTVEDRDRSRGLYYVRYVDPDKVSKKDSGFFSSFAFWGDEDQSDVNEYLISLVGSQSTTQVVILDTQGKRENSETADRILSLLHEQLK